MVQDTHKIYAAKLEHRYIIRKTELASGKSFFWTGTCWSPDQHKAKRHDNIRDSREEWKTIMNGKKLQKHILMCHVLV